MNPDKRIPGPSGGFTLIELLAVMVVISALVTIALPKIQNAIEKAKVARAIGDIRAIQSDLDGQDSLPDDLGIVGRDNTRDPWGNPYQYLKFPDKAHGAPAGARKDRFLVPLNSEYDLYSMGKDGQTKAPLSPPVSQDDIIRAYDGGFIGLASRF